MQKQNWLLLIAASFLAACSSFKVAEVDPSTGYFPSKKKASVVVMKPIDLDSRKGLIMVPMTDFDVGQVKNLNYFGEVITAGDLEKRIVAAGLSDKVPSVREPIGISKAAKHYKKFLWLRYGHRQDGHQHYAQLILTDPLTLQDHFVAETFLDTVWSGVNDQYNWYPLYNALLDYMRLYSPAFRKSHPEQAAPPK